MSDKSKKSKSKDIENPKKYLSDISPKRKEALEKYHKLLKSHLGYVPFPPFEISLPKHYPNGYPFGYLKSLYGEVYHDENF